MCACAGRCATCWRWSPSWSTSSTGWPCRPRACCRPRTGPTSRRRAATHDPAEAARLLDAAGYPDPDGPGGEPRLTAKPEGEHGPVPQVGGAGAAGAAGARRRGGGGALAGVRHAVQRHPPRQLRDGDAQVGLGHRAGPDARRVPLEERAHGGEPLGRPEPRRAEGLGAGCAVGRGEPGGAFGERKALYARAQERLDALLPYAPLWHESSVAVVSRRLEGFEPSAHGFLTPLARARRVEP